MSKKFLLGICLGLVLCGSFVYAKTVAENSIDFLSAFQNCDSFKSTDTIEIDGITSKVTKHLVGWDGYSCTYKETVEFKDLNFKSNVTCKFTGEQVREIYTIMKTESENSKKHPEKYQNMNLDTAQKSPVIQVWNKYLGDSSVCKIEM